LLETAGVEFDVIEYLSHPPDLAGFADLARRLTGEPAELIRKDPWFHSLGLDERGYTPIDAAAELLVAHPELMQRPLIDDGTVVVLARPPKRAEEWLAGR
jgi:arsenate reductase